MKPLFLQYANNETLKGMIEDHAGRHVAYCERHGYHYFPVVRLGEHFDWFDKIRLILEAAQSGNYSHVFWIDADCFVVDGAQDMRMTTQATTSFGFCIHPMKWQGRSFHFNVGVQYYKCTQSSIGFLSTVLELEGKCADEYDQTAINDLLMGFGTAPIFQPDLLVLEDQWNCTLGVHGLSPNNPPVVAAFHGHEFPERRREVMREWAERLPYR